MNRMVVFHDHWDEFDAWRADPAHPERADMVLTEAMDRFVEELEAAA